MNMILDEIGRCYRVAAEMAKRNHTRAYVQERAWYLAQTLQNMVLTLGNDPDATWIQEYRTDTFPRLLHVTREDPPNEDPFLVAQENGVMGCDDGQAVATYELKSTGVIRVVTDVVPDPPASVA